MSDAWMVAIEQPGRIAAWRRKLGLGGYGFVPKAWYDVFPQLEPLLRTHRSVHAISDKDIEFRGYVDSIVLDTKGEDIRFTASGRATERIG